MRRVEIHDEGELAAAVAEASSLLQAVTDYAGRDWHPKAAIGFPAGFIRTAQEQRSRLPFVRDAGLRSNLAYTLILSDTIHWLLARTRLTGTAHDMLVKLFFFLGGTLVESITKDYLRGHCNGGYKARTKHLADAAIITPSLKADLDWVWDMRTRMHLFLLDEAELINPYRPDAHARCVGAFRDLLAALRRKGRLPKRGAA